MIVEPERLPQARGHVDVLSESDGFVSGTNCEHFGTALAMLGGGREKKEDAIDPGVALTFHKRIGDPVKIGESLATIHYNSDVKLRDARDMIAASYLIAPEPPREQPRLIRRVIGEQK